MGLFDKTSFKYNDAEQNINPDDGIDMVKCKDPKGLNCRFRDNKGYCLFETCIKNIVIPHHKNFLCNCELCGKEYNIDTEVFIPGSSLLSFMCPDCLVTLKKYIKENP